MSQHIELNDASAASLKACADKLGINAEEAVARAVARMHLALFQDASADTAAVDYSQSLAADATSSAATVTTLPGLK